MDQRTRPAPRLAPLPADHTPELTDQFETTRKRMGFLPNSYCPHYDSEKSPFDNSRSGERIASEKFGDFKL